ncbi:MAG: hypothetical protein M3461_22430 [Pseudomonadota bacterium]|nr:hypothetical protein [Pseudomonadota bacterium]
MAGPVHDAPLPAATEGRDAPASAQPCPRADYLWVMPLARIYQVFPLSCPRGSASMLIIAFIT